MTLRQFFQIGGGALVSLIIYSTHLHPIIKWPLILFSFALGAALAFLPLEERTLDKWILAFFRSIYSPTLYFWQKSAQPPAFFAEEPSTPTATAPPHGEVVVENYLKTLPEQKTPSVATLESTEKSLLSKITSLFGGTPIPTPTTTPGQPVIIAGQPVVKEELNIPQAAPISVAAGDFRPKIVIEEKPVVEEPTTRQGGIAVRSPSPTLTPSDSVTGQTAQFSPLAAPPSPPSIPNTIVGQVLDSEGGIVESAILEIKDMAGRPVRALRSNKAGHFMIVTALLNGQYVITTEKEGYLFDPITIETTGLIIPPIAIVAKPGVNLQTEAEVQKISNPLIS